MNTCESNRKHLPGLVIGALGVVYGDIGTSPLYALRECFEEKHHIAASPANVLGVVSLIFWSLLVIVAFKYIMFVMRADNRGEGGILALLSLAFPDRSGKDGKRGKKVLIALGVFGAALLYGDGMITPPVSILGAMEGLNVATTRLDPYIIPITITILMLLFSFQRYGTGRVGKIFGPIMLAWFAAISLFGIQQIWQAPQIVAALNPWHGLSFFARNGWAGFIVLGAVFLCVTGGEALYADMGHFGRKPIQMAWFGFVMPALVLNYLGQGALLLRDPAAAANPFFNMCPRWSLIPMVVLATTAAVIASQALISGAFSLTMQAIQLGYAPRLEIEHTSSDARGQIYLPRINTLLMVCCIGLVLGFRTSSNLAAAYGIAVTLTMLITTVLFYFAARRLWGWPKYATLATCSVFAVVELAFFTANFLKIAHGGWFPLLIGAVVYSLMATWKRGRYILGERMRATSLPIQTFLDSIENHPPHRVSGTAVFLAGNSEGTPMALLHNLKHNKILHERVVILTIATEEIPHVNPAQRVTVQELNKGFYRVKGSYGFMEDPNVPNILEACKPLGLKFDAHRTTFFLSRETIIPTNRPGMAIWREKLFAFMARNAHRATAFFKLPANRVVELGMLVEI